MASVNLHRSVQIQLVWVRRHVYRGGQPRGRLAILRQFLASLGAVYTVAFTFLSLFSGFWLTTLIFMQISNPKVTTLNVFPGGLNDAGTLLPLAILAFSGLLFAAQQSVNSGTAFRGLYGYAAKSLMNAFYFLAMAFVLAMGTRLMPSTTFDRWRGGWLLHQLVVVTLALMLLSAAIAGCFLVGGLVAFARSLGKHTS